MHARAVRFNTPSALSARRSHARGSTNSARDRRAFREKRGASSVTGSGSTKAAAAFSRSTLDKPVSSMAVAIRALGTDYCRPRSRWRASALLGRSYSLTTRIRRPRASTRKVAALPRTATTCSSYLSSLVAEPGLTLRSPGARASRSSSFPCVSPHAYRSR